MNRKILTALLLVFFAATESSAQLALFDKIDALKDSVSTMNLHNHIVNLSFAGGHESRVNFTPGNDSGAAYILREFSKFPGLQVSADTFYITGASSPYNTKPLVNIIATLPGRSNPDKYFIIGAHHDCSASRMGSTIWQNQWSTIKAPGADDNATGIAAILEIARILSDSSNGFQGEYSIRLIAFAAEESGPAYPSSHHGSRDYAARARARNEQIIGMVSVDMIGYNDFHLYNAFVSNGFSDWIADKYREANDLFEIGLITNNAPYPYAVYSDHDVFWAQGYNAILMIENAPPWINSFYYQANPFYHTSGDSTGTLNFELVRKVTQLNLVSAASFAGALTGVKSTIDTDPKFDLVQNYPNPFNPETVISYRLDEKSFVSLNIYDALGRLVSALESGEKNPGEHSVTFNGVGLSSGVYFYSLQAQGENGNTFSSVRKMTLLK